MRDPDADTAIRPRVKLAHPPTPMPITQRLQQRVIADWYGEHVWIFGSVLFAITSIVLILYYLNVSRPEFHPDTGSYTQVALKIMATGQLVDAFRTPGYPLFLAIIFAIVGKNNLGAVAAMQGVLFVATVLEVYAIGYVITRRAWIAFIAALFLGINTYIFGYVTLVLAEGFTLWLLVTLTLLVILFLRQPQLGMLWAVAGGLLVLFMTRPDWLYLPILLFAYLLFIVARRGQWRRFLPHMAVALVAMYLLAGIYAFANGVQNGYYGYSDVQNVNLLGKVLQYHMQNEADPTYASLASQVNAYVATGNTDPYALATMYPTLQQDHWKLAGSYATSAVIHHPVEFLVKTIPVMFFASTYYYDWAKVNPYGHFGSVLHRLQQFSLLLYKALALFPLLALPWIVLLFWRRTTREWMVEAMGAILVIAFYELFMTAAGTYVDYPRLHVPLNALMTLVLWTTPLLGVTYLWQWWQHRQTNTTDEALVHVGARQENT